MERFTIDLRSSAVEVVEALSFVFSVNESRLMLNSPSTRITF